MLYTSCTLLSMHRFIAVRKQLSDVTSLPLDTGILKHRVESQARAFPKLYLCLKSEHHTQSMGQPFLLKLLIINSVCLK